MSQPPRWLVVAAAVILAQLILSPGVDLQWNDASRTALGILLVGLLLWGSRVAWVIILLGVLYQIGSSVDSAQWRLATGAVITLCLLAPSSLQYVWVTPVEQKSGWMGQRALELYLGIRSSAYAIAHWLIGWEDGKGDRVTPLWQRTYSAGLWRFGLGSLLFFFLAGATGIWKESTEGVLIVNIIAGVMWICYLVTQLTFVILAVLGIWSSVVRFRRQGQQQRIDEKVPVPSARRPE